MVTVNKGDTWTSPSGHIQVQITDVRDGIVYHVFTKLPFERKGDVIQMGWIKEEFAVQLFNQLSLCKDEK
jgi:hypothetical protein